MGSMYNGTCMYQPISDGNTTDWSQFINHTSDLLVKSMATDIIGRYEVLFPLDHKWHFRKTLERTESWRKAYLVEGAYDFF